MTDQQTPQSPLPTVNQGAQDIVTLVENLGAQGEKAAEVAIIAQAPAMGNPILMRIWEPLFDMLLQLFLKPLATLGGQVVISAEEYGALKKVTAAQAALDQAKKTGDSHAVQAASQSVDQALASAVRYIGSTHA